MGGLLCLAALLALASCEGGSDGTSLGGSGGAGAEGGGTGASGGAGGSGAAGGAGGAETCTPGEALPCYEGPPDTQGKGACEAGTRMCKANGEGFGPCLGQVVPAEETCDTEVDDDCDGEVNESGPGCACTPGSLSGCYSGPPPTQGVGECHGGSQVCNPEGTGYGECMGEVVPDAETCLSPGDEDCDGFENEEGAGCACFPGQEQSCYTGPPDTLGVGACAAGTRLCDADGTGWGPCEGDVTPVTETCATPVDDDCNGQVNEGGADCACVPGTVTSCYTGPAATQFVGACSDGLALCDAQGQAYGECMGEVLPAAEDCATPVDEDCIAEPDCGEAVWALGQGSAAQQQAAGVARVHAGGAVVVGAFAGTLPLGGGAALVSAGGADAFVARIGAGGQVIWSKGFGSAGMYEQASSVVVDPTGNVIVTGYFDGTIDFGGGPLASAGNIDMFVVKLDPDGGHLWSKRFGGAGPQLGVDVALDPQGDVILVAKGFGAMDFGGGALASAGAFDVFVAKLDAGGGHVWSQRFGAALDEDPVGVAADGAGNVVIAGSCAGTVDFGGGPLAGQGGYDAFVVKLGPAGNHLWSARYGNGANQGATGIDVAVGGDVLVTGGFEGSIDFGAGPLTAASPFDVFVARLSPAGTALFSKAFGATDSNIESRAIAAGPAGEVFVAGAVEGDVDLGGGLLPGGGAADVFVVRLDATGAPTWGVRYGEAAHQHPASLAALPDGGVLTCGDFEGLMSFGPGIDLASAGGMDLWVAHLAP